MHRTLPIGVGRVKAVRQELPDTARLFDRLGAKHRGCDRRAYRSPVRKRPNKVIAFPLPKTSSSIARTRPAAATPTVGSCPSVEVDQ